MMIFSSIGITNQSYCQNTIDSLKLELENTTDTSRVRLLNELFKIIVKNDL